MDGISSNFTVYFLLIISIVLLSVNLIDLINIVKSWNNSYLINTYTFEKCIEYPLISKTCFAFYSILTAIEIVTLSLLLLIDLQLFLEKFLGPFIKIIAYINGPLLLTFCILGFSNWGKVVYLCDDNNNYVISISNVLSIVLCFILSVFVTFLSFTYNSVILIIDSILNKPEGNSIIYNLFWIIVKKKRKAEDDRLEQDRIILQRNNNMNIDNYNNNNNNNENINNIVPHNITINSSNDKLI